MVPVLISRGRKGAVPVDGVDDAGVGEGAGDFEDGVAVKSQDAVVDGVSGDLQGSGGDDEGAVVQQTLIGDAVVAGAVTICPAVTVRMCVMENVSLAFPVWLGSVMVAVTT